MNNETSTAEKTSESVTIKNNFSKTPMMVLAEMMNKQGKQPIYEMVEEPKLFRYRVSCDSFSGKNLFKDFYILHLITISISFQLKEKEKPSKKHDKLPLERFFVSPLKTINFQPSIDQKKTI